MSNIVLFIVALAWNS